MNTEAPRNKPQEQPDSNGSDDPPNLTAIGAGQFDEEKPKLKVRTEKELEEAVLKMLLEVRQSPLNGLTSIHMMQKLDLSEIGDMFTLDEALEKFIDTKYIVFGSKGRPIFVITDRGIIFLQECING